ncbi:hypothetical protein [Spirosoma rigui]|uniref:hypothetical protein n=1 Tax=Spirosoma rigui TaxID=564064 RepID=UPI0009AF8797|nr:hypothetical protein [Spirosoma rigui]
MSGVKLTQLDASLKKRREKNRDLLVKAVVNGFGYLQGFRRLRVIDEIVLSTMYTKSLLQPGGKGAFNPKADVVNFEARIGKVRPWKVDVEIDEPTRLQMEASYLGEIEGNDGLNPLDFPFADYIYKGLTDQIGEDFGVNALWKGVLNGAGTNPQDVFNGFIKLDDDAILSDEIPEANVIVHSAADFFINEDNVIAEFKRMWKRYVKQLPAYADKDVEFFLPSHIKTAYDFALEKANGQTRTYNQFKQEVLYFAPNVRLNTQAGLGGTDYMSMTPKENMVYLSSRQDDAIDLTTDYNVRDRSIAIVADGKAAPNFVRGDLKIVSDLRDRPAAADAEDDE